MIDRIARTMAAACVVIAIAFAIWRRDPLAAMAVCGGGALMAFSFWSITSLVNDFALRFQGESGGKGAGFSLVKFFTRHAIVALAAYGMMVRLRLDPIGLLAGVSSLGVAVGVEVLRDLRWRRFL